MAISNEQFWHLAAASGLLTSERCQLLAGQFGLLGDTAHQGDAVAVAKWLVSTRVLSHYQASVLLRGQPGPFQFGEYQVFDRIDKGRLKGTLRAVHLPTQHVVFLKLLTGPATQDPQVMKALTQRAATATAIRHETVSRCYQLVAEEDYKFIALEPLQGQTLAEYLKKKRTLSAPNACRIASDCATALAELHSHGVIHALLSPTNIWLLPDGRAKVLQFPLASDPSVDSRVVQSALSRAADALMSTGAQPSSGMARAIDFLPPEVLVGNTTPDARGDIYALGCTLYAMLCGQAPPLGTDSIAERLRFRVEHEIPLLDDSLPDVPGPVAKLIGFMIARDPAARYQAASHVVEALKPFAAEDTSVGEPPLPRSLAYQQWLDDRASKSQSITDVGFTIGGATQDGLDTLSSESLATSTVPLMKRKRRDGFRAFLLAGCVVLAVLAVVWYLLRPSEIATFATGNTKNDGTTSATLATSKVGHGEAPSSVNGTPLIRSALGPPQWESPTAGKPLDLSYLPPGVQIVFALRPSAIVAHREGDKLLDAMGRWGELLRKDLVEIAGTPLANIERVHVGLLDNSPNPPLRAWVIWTIEPISWDQRLDQWEGGETFELSGKKVFQRDGIVFVEPRSGEGRLLVVAPREAAEEILATSGKPPRLRRELEVLAENSDADRMINVLFAPNFLFSGGKQLFADEAEILKRPVADFLGEEARGGLLSLHLDEDFFIELRLHGSADQLPLVMARNWRKRVHGIPSRVSSHVWSLEPSPYSRKVLAQLPQMVEMLEKYTRVAVEGRQTILRCYLPVEAAHNLALATRLTLYESSGTPTIARQATSQPTMSVAERLAGPYELTIPRGPLDQAVAQVSRDLGVAIVILGNDLQLEGITKNQSFALKVEDSTFRGVLLEILRLSNPDGKLVYVIKPKPDGGDEAIYITTRAAVSERGDPLPPEFATK